VLAANPTGSVVTLSTGERFPESSPTQSGIHRPWIPAFARMTDEYVTPDSIGDPPPLDSRFRGNDG